MMIITTGYAHSAVLPGCEPQAGAAAKEKGKKEEKRKEEKEKTEKEESSIHPKNEVRWGYTPAIFFGFSTKFYNDFFGISAKFRIL